MRKQIFPHLILLVFLITLSVGLTKQISPGPDESPIIATVVTRTPTKQILDAGELGQPAAQVENIGTLSGEVTQEPTSQPGLPPTPEPSPAPPQEISQPEPVAKPTEAANIPVSGGEGQNNLPLSPDQWKEWPVLPVVSEEMRQLYLEGLQNGNNPHAFSILGDCQSKPKVFLGRFDSDQALVVTLSQEYQETIQQFSGSFNRYSPTVKDGSTEGAMLWAEWNDNEAGKCEPNETPLACELRVQKPSIVLVHLGTHYETRNRRYLTTIIEKLLEQKILPVMVTKADNREKDERINHNIVSLAAEYGLPVWNFWASVQGVDHQGLQVGSNMYLSEEAEEIHRMGALETLNIVWRAVKE